MTILDNITKLIIVNFSTVKKAYFSKREKNWNWITWSSSRKTSIRNERLHTGKQWINRYSILFFLFLVIIKQIIFAVGQYMNIKMKDIYINSTNTCFPVTCHKNSKKMLIWYKSFDGWVGRSDICFFIL